jgi:nicotinate-nucleotide adenylyltransferase
LIVSNSFRRSAPIPSGPNDGIEPREPGAQFLEPGRNNDSNGTRDLLPSRGGLRRIGILGGSFNPAHSGHLHISLRALMALGLDEVWWLVAPQNPLKPAAGMATFRDRLAAARQAAVHPRIKVSDFEARQGTGYTADTLGQLRRRHAGVRFVWLMGADNMVQIPQWKHWPRIFETVPVAVFDRPTYSYRALAGVAARRFERARRRGDGARSLVDCRPPAWIYVWCVRDPQSATALRRKGVQD